MMINISYIVLACMTCKTYAIGKFYIQRINNTCKASCVISIICINIIDQNNELHTCLDTNSLCKNLFTRNILVGFIVQIYRCTFERIEKIDKYAKFLDVVTMKKNGGGRHANYFNTFIKIMKICGCINFKLKYCN